MNGEYDEYDVFLDNWEPSEILQHATLKTNLHDPVARARLIEDSTGAAELARTAFVAGTKMMPEIEKKLRKYEFIEAHQAEWSSHFRDYVLAEGVDEKKFEQFVY